MTARKSAGRTNRRPPEGSNPTIVAVRVKPGSARAGVGGRVDGPYGPALVVAVHAPPVDGQATEAARRALAGALGVRAAAVTLRAGGLSRDKLFAVDAPPAGIAQRLRCLRDGGAR
jgi:uncharacterized protein